MESEIFSPPRDLVKCCDCACPTCSLIGKPSSTWFRSVKRKYDEFETGDRFYVPGFDLYSNPKVQIENECAALRETVCSQQEKIQDLHAELEKERNASSSAATEAMSMILKLEKQKAEIQMEASQFKRFAEEKMAHDQEEIHVLEDLLYKKDQSVQSLTCEALAYKHRMMSYGLTEAEAEGDKDGEIRNLGMAEDFDAQVDLPEYDYPQLKCNMNENPGDDAEDVEKYAFGETPHARDQLRNLEQRIFQVERSSGGSQLDGGCSGTKHVFEKVIVGHSPRRTRHSRRFSIDSYNSFLAKETASEFTIDSPRFHIGSPRFNASHKKMEFISRMDEISSSKRMDNASEVEDDTSDRVYTIDPVHNGAVYNETLDSKPGVGITDEYASTPREQINLPDACDPDIIPLMHRGDADVLVKLKLAQLQQQQQQLQQQQQQQQNSSSQHALLNQQPQTSNPSLLQQDKVGGGGSVTVDGSMSNSFRGNDQVSKNQNGRKRKQPVSSSGPANSSGTANTAGPSPSSAPSTPSTHTPGDVISMPALPHSGSSSKPLMMFGADGAGTLTSPSNQLWDDKDLELQADMDRFVEDGSLDDNVESFLSHDDTDPRDAVGRCVDVTKGVTFMELNSVRASNNKVTCCHFSSDGKLLASGGHDKKAVLWYTDTLKPKSTLEEHSCLITDVRFSPSMSRFATSSFDKTVRVWDADSPGYSLRTFSGHSGNVMSLDFHPTKDDLICSCDGDGEIRYWSINHGSCARVFKGGTAPGTAQLRFQPRFGKYLALAAENVVSILDAETQTCRYSLQGHTKLIHSVCWDLSGELLASVSEDSVRVWSFGSGSEGECVHELSCNGNKFHSCVFHPTSPSLLVIGCYQSLELWNMTEGKTKTLSAHEGLIAALAVSPVTGLVSSASHDKFIKLWKSYNC